MFEGLIVQWSQGARRSADTCVGPFLSWNSLEYYVQYWPSLADSFKGIWKGKDTLCLEPTFSWQFDDRWGDQLKVRRFSKDGLIAFTEDGQEWSSSCPLEEGGELVRLRRMTWMQFGEHCLYKDRSDFKVIQEVPSVPSQLRWSPILDW